jgi:5,10-methylenetetrahydromethanopterin reductase
MTLASRRRPHQRIGLGPGVLIPTLRHVMTNAAAIATWNSKPRARFVGIGTGFTGRLALVNDHSPRPRARLRAHAQSVAAGVNRVEVDGAKVQMLHGPGQAVERPIEVPMVLAAGGPKASPSPTKSSTASPTSSLLRVQMVGPHGARNRPRRRRNLRLARVLEAAGPGAAVLFHAGYEHALLDGLDQVPGAAEWRTAIASIPADERHLHTHAGHLTYANEIDRQVLNGSIIEQLTFSGTEETLRKRLVDVANAGVTEVVYQPAGPDPERELRAFARMADLTNT